MEPEITFEPFIQAERLPSSLPWAVYRATDSRNGHPVRLSVLWAAEHASPERARAGLDWFAEAGYQAQRLTDSGLPSVLSYKSTGDSAYVATDFPAGQTLRDRIEMLGPLPVARAMHVSSLIASVLAKAHAVGWAHGWLNPETVWLSDTDLPTVTDLGLGLAALPLSPGNPVPFTTRPGFLSGDPLRRDLQCLGLVLTLMLTGHLPDPVGLPRADVFPDEVPGGVVNRIRSLINPRVENPMTAAQWAQFARVGESPVEEPPVEKPDESYYEAPSRVKAGSESGPRPWGRYAIGAGGVVALVALVAAGNALMGQREPTRPGPAQPASRPAATGVSAAATAPGSPVPDTLTKVQVGPISPGDEENVATRLKGMGFDPYIRREGGQVYIQVGAFANAEGAQATKDEISRAGLPVRVQ